MANPRKFSDKLEIIRRKEEEANAAFDKIMREVSDARSGTPTAHPPHHPHQSAWFRGQNDMRIRQKYKGGSLPNVNLAPNPITVESNLYNDMYNQQAHSYNMNYMRRPMDPPSGPIFPSKNKPRSYTVTAPYRNNLLQQPNSPIINEQQNESQSSMWRRTFSDSAIQHSLQQPPKKMEGSPLAQGSGGPRLIQSQPMKNNDIPNYPSPPSIQFNDTPPPQKSHMQMQANTNSLPDLSNLSIPSPIQNPLDSENNEKANSPQEIANPFQAPFRVPPPRRMVGRQIYSRPSTNNDMDQKLNLFTGMSIDKNDLNNSMNNNNVVSHPAPISPVTPPPYYWNSQPMSPLATEDLMQQVNNAPPDLQQQLQQFQLHSETNSSMAPPPYPYMSANEQDNYNNYYQNSGSYTKQPVYRISSGPAHMSSMGHSNKEYKSNQICDRQLDSALMKVKSENNYSNNEISEEDLNSVRLALNPLDFDDVSILNDNTDLVDQTTEEQFRLERSSGFQ